ncbi:hypothetical protein P153DRAFT_366731 [Dothidotthia symphoricarpi CBS 119687]|uniref:F-box domain-containing protein n=1 Tax=Dothidotthia symphoricarpi CBS 119687 TaxID=1392245 RepID=A0A6A6AC06_9PLEO|nr:uncharacterized protein P153DRAFT_366731 [Dothidotthia symphoricarpi CBS 119687]KAF2129320.1 hypothetical protein P153DRAFT_366731 [Dothidotthia symphoricarpi CBS 119687]
METLQPLLFRLPRELRDEIYQYTLDDDLKQQRLDFQQRHDVRERAITPPIRALPPICGVSKQVYYEATPFFLSQITPLSLTVETTCWLRKWLATFPSETGYRAIRQLAFRSFHGPEQIKGFELIALCPNLRSLDVMFGDEYSDPGTVPSLAIESLSSAANAYDTLENIVVMHQLHRYIEIPKLERMDFGFHDWQGDVSCERARQVMEWLRVKFHAKGRDVHIECQQMRQEMSDSDDDFVCALWD